MFQPDPFNGSTIEDLTVWVDTQFQKLASLHTEFEADSIRLAVHNSEPDRPRAGHIYYADGTNWDPGSGEGIYYYTSGSAWALLG